MSPRSSDRLLDVGLIDLTSGLDLDNNLLIIGKGFSSVVFSCLDTKKNKVAVKAIISSGVDSDEQKVIREFLIWNELKHPNIVPLLGWSSGGTFGTVYPCMVSAWMPNGTLFDHVKKCGTALLLPDRLELIKGSAAAMKYLHSEGVIHGDFHPANILIDAHQCPRVTDFGLSRTLDRGQDQSDPGHPGALLWSAPELLYPVPNLEFRVTLEGDIYSTGSVIFFILSGQFPWKNEGEAQNRLKEFKNPSRPPWPIVFPDGVWNFIERCWSPKDPGSRPSAQDVLSFCMDKLERLLVPNPINVMLFGHIGSGKSSIVSLLAGKSVVPVSSDEAPHIERPRSYSICINQKHFQMQDTMGFALQHEGSAVDLLPYEHAHSILRNLPDPTNLILLCADKDAISPSLGHLYWFINHFFYDGHAPIVLVFTNFDMDVSTEEWWENNKKDIAKRTSIPVDSIPYVCVVDPAVGYQPAKNILEELLQTHATAIIPIPIRPDFSSCAAASVNLATHCGLQETEANVLVEKFKDSPHPFNVVLFGDSGSEITLVVDLIGGGSKPRTSPFTRTTTLGGHFCRIAVLDTMSAGDRKDVMEVLENGCRLIRSLSSEGAGIDLLVFCKRFGELTEKEMAGYRLFKEIFCKGQSPVAVVITQFESPQEKWWDTDGEKLLKTIFKDAVDHACIPPLVTYDPSDHQLDERLAEHSLSVQAMMERCIQVSQASFNVKSLRKGTGYLGNFVSWKKERKTLQGLREHYGLTLEQVEKIRQYFK